MATIEETREKLKQWRWQQGWAEPYTCPQCGSGKLEGEGMGEPSEAEKMQQAGWPALLADNGHQCR